jgi:hypothetical protein
VCVAQVADLQWLPGLEFGAHGRLQPAGSRPNSSNTPAAAAGGQQQGKGCCVLATTAADGRVLFWDSRVERLLRKGRRAEDATEVAWKPSHSMHLLSSQGMDLQVGGGRLLSSCFGSPGSADPATRASRRGQP